MRSKSLVLAAISALMAGCQGPTVTSLENLLAAPLQVSIGSRIMTLDPFVYVNLMPGTPVEGSGLIAGCLITAEDGQPYPLGLDADKVWVIAGDEVWEGDFSEEAGPPDQSRLHQLQKVARGGPQWQVGTGIEVVVRLITASGVRQLLRATGEQVGAAY